MNPLRKAIHRLKIILRVSRWLSADWWSAIRMAAGGIWFLLNDSWKSRCRFEARIKYSGEEARFVFEDVGDFELFDEVFVQASYTTLDNLPPAPVIFDLGANIGVSALYFRLRFPDSTIHCFEPDPANYRRLVRLQEQFNRFHLHQIAVWNETGTVRFFSDGHRGSSSSLFRTHDRQIEVVVPSETLSGILKLTGLDRADLLKLDVEGAEEKIFEGFGEYGRFGMIAGELHNDRCDTQNLQEALKQHYRFLELHPLKKDRYYVIAHNGYTPPPA